MPSLLSRRALIQAVSSGLACAALPSVAQPAWPSRPIRIIVPYTAGGFTDQMARLLQVGLQKRLGQPVVIDNKPGANSIIGVDAVAKAAPDGHTFGVVIAAYAANTTLYPKLPYNPAKDLVGVSLMGISPLLAAVPNNAPFKNVTELVAYAKANPGKISFGSSGNGSAAHLTSELLKAVTKTYMIHIPYRGAAPALTASRSWQSFCSASTACAGVRPASAPASPRAMARGSSDQDLGSRPDCANASASSGRPPAARNKAAVSAGLMPCACSH